MNILKQYSLHISTIRNVDCYLCDMPFQVNPSADIEFANRNYYRSSPEYPGDVGLKSSSRPLIRIILSTFIKLVLIESYSLRQLS